MEQLSRMAWRAVTRSAPISEPLRLRGALIFTDISGFSQLTLDHVSRGSYGLEDLHGLINAIFATMISEVQAAGGDIVALVGDALIACFDASSYTDQVGKEAEEIGLRLACQKAIEAAARCTLAVELFNKNSPSSSSSTPNSSAIPILPTPSHRSSSSSSSLGIKLHSAVTAGDMLGVSLQGGGRLQFILCGPATMEIGPTLALASGGQIAISNTTLQYLGDSFLERFEVSDRGVMQCTPLSNLLWTPSDVSSSSSFPNTPHPNPSIPNNNNSSVHSLSSLPSFPASLVPSAPSPLPSLSPQINSSSPALSPTITPQLTSSSSPPSSSFLFSSSTIIPSYAASLAAFSFASVPHNDDDNEAANSSNDHEPASEDPDDGYEASASLSLDRQQHQQQSEEEKETERKREVILRQKRKSVVMEVDERFRPYFANTSLLDPFVHNAMRSGSYSSTSSSSGSSPTFSPNALQRRLSSSSISSASQFPSSSCQDASSTGDSFLSSASSSISCSADGFHNVTVVFANLSPDPIPNEHYLPHLHTSFECLATVAARFEATIIKSMADDKGVSVLLAFGLPWNTVSDPCVRAVAMCLQVKEFLAEAEKQQTEAEQCHEMERRKSESIIGDGHHQNGEQDPVHDLYMTRELRGDELEEMEHVKRPGIRFGVSTGTVFCGFMGTISRREFTLLGDRVNLAARLMSLAPEQENGILVDDQVEQQVRGKFVFNSLGSIEMKGMVGRELHCFQAISSVPGVDIPLPATIVPLPSPLPSAPCG